MSVCNCKSPRGGCMCPSGYECCSQLTPNGEESSLGVCCKKNHCDRSRGICSERPIIERYDSESIAVFSLAGVIGLFFVLQFVHYLVKRYGK